MSVALIEKLAEIKKQTRPSDAVRSLPYYDLVPKGVNENAEYRIKVLDWAAQSKEHQQTLINACAQDILFYCNVFCWTFDPRPKLEDNPLFGYGKNMVPFITYSYQDNLFMEMVAAVRNGYSLVIPKSRTTGISVCGMTAFDWLARFFPWMSFLVGSRKFEYVDDPEVADALLPKIDIIHEMQPGWLRPRITRNTGKIVYHDTRSVITGEACNPNFGRSGRSTATWPDEFAFVDCAGEVFNSLMENSPCNFFVSTPHGTGNTFYELAHNPGYKQYPVPWYHHPIYGKGLFMDDEGELWSPWMMKKAESLSAQTIAQEYRIDWRGSDSTFFSQTMLAKKISQFVCNPASAGRLDYREDGTPGDFQIQLGGLLRLWGSLKDGKHPPVSAYVIGIDIAAGTQDHHGRGWSNSVASVVNRSNGEKVAEWAVSGVDPMKFARMCVALARWFTDDHALPAFMIWDATGPAGSTFTKTVMDLGYSRIWYSEKMLDPSAPFSGKPGWWMQGNKDALLRNYAEALADDRFINHSLEALREAMDYIQLANGDLVYSRSEQTDDPTGARANHGDRVIADSLACWVITQRVLSHAREEPEVVYGSRQWREQYFEEQEKKNDRPWLTRSRRELSLLI
jgi:hypothetical protein